MAYLLRKLSDKDAWAEVVDSHLWEADDCPPEALVQVFDNRTRVSTWRVVTEEELERVVAAQAFMRSTIGDFAYCLIDEKRLVDEGIKTENHPQGTIDKDIDDHHVDIVGLTGKQLIRLAHMINSEFYPLVMTRDEILKTATRLFGEGKFNREFLFTGGKKGRSDVEIANSKDLLVNLWKKKELSLT